MPASHCVHFPWLSGGISHQDWKSQKSNKNFIDWDFALVWNTYINWVRQWACLCGWDDARTSKSSATEWNLPIRLDWLAKSLRDPPVSSSPGLCGPHPAFYVSSRGSNSGPRTYIASTLLTESFSKRQEVEFFVSFSAARDGTQELIHAGKFSLFVS